MNAKKKWWRRSRLYLILDKEACGAKKPAYVLEEAIRGGVDIVQYRDKLSPAGTAIKEAARLSRICRDHRVPFIINDRLDVALEVPCDGIHLGQDDLAVALARVILGKDAIIGLSCHSPGQVRNAQTQDADYLGFGPVFKTKTKPDVKPRGVGESLKALKISKKPVVVIGGMTAGSIDLLPVVKPLHIAVCRDICAAADVRAAARKIKNKLP